jgi:hypothetical protein
MPVHDGIQMREGYPKGLIIGRGLLQFWEDGVLLHTQPFEGTSGLEAWQKFVNWMIDHGKRLSPDSMNGICSKDVRRIFAPVLTRASK